MKTTIQIQLLLLILSMACKEPPVSREQARQEILKQHYAQQQYHLEENVEAFVDLLSEDHVSVNRGAVTQAGHEAIKDRFRNYFGAVEFEQWEDTAEPVIRFSDDNTLAYSIVQKDVVTRYQNESGQTLRDSVHYAWLAVYHRDNSGEWKVETVASTNAEPVVMVVE